MTDRICLSGMRFFGHHGVFAEETRLGQQFIVDAEMYLDVGSAGRDDDLSATVDYGQVYQLIRSIVEGQPVQLLETLAERIADQVLRHFAITEVVVRVHKPGAPIPGPFDGVMVEVRRRQEAYLSLGSNLGDRLDMLVQAVRRLGNEHVEITGVSSVYETTPQGKVDQPDFLNIVLAVRTDLTPRRLLQHVLRVEQDLGRVRSERWGPRTVDIDLLLYGPTVCTDDELTLPHPRMTERAFVLVPLLELAADLALPTDGSSLRSHLQRLPDQGVQATLDASAFRKRLMGLQ
ncbi:MAG: 2-amino-4-hydroxy-6-hydroxymethyldihydropteridine diphosphokinase [Mycobacterium leprae]